MTYISCRSFVYLLLLIILQWTNCSLLSRFRYPNEYVAPPEASIITEDLPDDLYENLIDERPDLEPILGPSRKTKTWRPKMPYIRKTTSVLPANPIVQFVYYDHPESEADEEGEERKEREEKGEEQEYNNITSRSAPTTYQQAELVEYHTTQAAGSPRMLPFLLSNMTHNDTRRWWWGSGDIWNHANVKARCYTCGETSRGVTLNPICHDAFESDDWRARTLGRYFKSICIYNSDPYYRDYKRRATYYWHDYFFEANWGLKTERIGNYIGGCFKRYLDVGTIYTSRGCRTAVPSDAGGFAANRFLKLELLLLRFDDRCITSPYASLTPFSRGISLWARYHVCVCPDRFCNRATTSKAYNTSLIVLSLICITLLL